MRYTDELDTLLERELRLRHQIAVRIAEEAGEYQERTILQTHIAAADEAIVAWGEEGEEAQDVGAFRPIGPLQQLLIDHRQTCDRIVDTRDRSLS